MDEEAIAISLTTYQEQLRQVEAALTAAGETNNDELVKLRSDLKELIQLTQESLLAAKKSRLLSMLDGSSKGNDVKSAGTSSNNVASASSSSQQSEIDAEFAAFQSAIAEDLKDDSKETSKHESSSSGSFHVSHSSSPSHSPAQDDDDDPEDDISGMKCRVSYTQDWGEMRWHNAMVIGSEPMQNDGEPRVRVLFCNPTHRSMKPCSFFLDGRCKFTEEDCRYSHGYVLPVAELHDFKDPNYSAVKLDTKCLAKDTDDLWYPGTVVEVTDGHKEGHSKGHMVKVMLDSTHQVIEVDLHDVLPSEKHDGSSESEDDLPNDTSDEESIDDIHDEDDELAIPVFLWRPKTTEKMADWEAHTRGIGSKLMMKWGYVMGEGLGINKEGRAEPVPIQLLPPGKSLDKIMQLKEEAGDQDLYNVLKQQKRKKKSADKKKAKHQKTEAGPTPSVFDFINKRLGDKKVSAKQKHETESKKSVKHISEKDLKEKSDKNIGVQLLKTQGEIRSVDKNIQHLKERLAANEGKDKVIAEQLRHKIAGMETYKNQLRRSESSLQKHKDARSHHKKLTIF